MLIPKIVGWQDIAILDHDFLDLIQNFFLVGFGTLLDGMLILLRRCLPFLSYLLRFDQTFGRLRRGILLCS